MMMANTRQHDRERAEINLLRAVATLGDFAVREARAEGVGDGSFSTPGTKIIWIVMTIFIEKQAEIAPSQRAMFLADTIRVQMQREGIYDLTEPDATWPIAGRWSDGAIAALFLSLSISDAESQLPGLIRAMKSYGPAGRQ